MKKAAILTLCILGFVGATAGVSSALSINTNNATYGDIPGNPSSAYNDLLGDTIAYGYYGAHLEFTVGEQVTFEFLGEEAGWNNEFHVNRTQIFTNNGSAWGASQTFTVGDNFNFSFLADSGTKGSVINGYNPDDSAAGVPGPNFFVTDLRNSSITLGANSYLGEGTILDKGIYLWLDDGGANSDDNHDDMLIKVTASATPVPEPATILLMGPGLLGLAAYRRKRSIK